MAASPFVWRRRSATYSEPARTLSAGDDGSSRVRARFACTHCHVPGRICITPRALAPDSIALLLPLSCQAIAAASDPGAPCWAAIEPTWPDVRRPGDAAGGAARAGGEAPGRRGGRRRRRDRALRRRRGGHDRRAGRQLDDRAGEERLGRI